MALMNRNDVKKVIEDLNEKPFVCTEHYIETTSGFIITTKEKSKYHRVKSRPMQTASVLCRMKNWQIF